MPETIPAGTQHTFHSTMHGEGYGARSGQTVTVLGLADAPDAEPVDQHLDEYGEFLYRVQFPDGFQGLAYAGELNGYYLRTGQSVSA